MGRVTVPRISIIICTYNRSSSLQRVLSSLARQTVFHDCFEVIVVDDGSTDSTAEVCGTFSKILSHFVSVPVESNRGSAHGRNIGLKHSRGELVLFTDDDCVPAPDWIEQMVDALGEHMIVVGCIDSPRSSKIELAHNISQFHPFMPGRKARPVSFVAGANMAFRRSVFEDLGGFREDLERGMDTEYIFRARKNDYCAYFAPSALVTHHCCRFALKEILEHSREHALVTIQLRQQYKDFLGTPAVLRSEMLLLLFAPIISSLVTVSIFMKNRRLLADLPFTFPIVFCTKLAWCCGARRGLRLSCPRTESVESQRDVPVYLSSRKNLGFFLYKED